MTFYAARQNAFEPIVHGSNVSYHKYPDSILLDDPLADRRPGTGEIYFTY